MEIVIWIRFILGAALILFGIGIFFVEIFGLFKFRYVLNRMHAAAMGDTLGLGSVILGLILLNGVNFVSLKLFCVILFLWIASPVASHLMAQMEVETHKDLTKYEEIEDVASLDEINDESEGGNTNA